MLPSALVRTKAAWLLPLLLVAGLLVPVGPAAPGANAAASPDPSFPVLAQLRPAVAFWIDIYSRYTTDQTVLHDSERLDVVYGVLDFSELARRPMGDLQRVRGRASAEELEKEQIRSLLRDIALYADRPERLTPEQRRIYDLFPPDGPRVTGARFLDAAERVRVQVGQRDRFIEGIRVGGRYLPEMERIFEQEGVPVELTRLVFVESMFNLRARSSAGASGVWQFIRSTGHRYLRIDDLVDERNDPLLAARAAARLLADNYADLQSWPLAVTAYNHGKYGMLRAVAETGSRDLAKIVAEYRGPAFAFASRNFYAEFLAARHVERNARRYLGPIKLDEPPHYALVAMPGHLTAADLARRARVEVSDLRALNPALTDRAVKGNRPLPRGYALRVPTDRRARLVAARFDVRPGWRPPIILASRQTPRGPADKGGGLAVALAAAAATGTPGVGRLAVYRTADQSERLAAPAAEAPKLDPEIYRAQMMAAEQEALDLLLAAQVPEAAAAAGTSESAANPDPGASSRACEPAETECVASLDQDAGRGGVLGPDTPVAAAGSDLQASPPEAAGDRLVDAAVEALALNAPAPAVETPGAVADAEPTERVVQPGSRIVPSVAPAGPTLARPTLRTAVRGGETVWRLAEWSEEPIEAFRARNRLAADQSLPAGRPVTISTARVDRETFEARRAAFHDALRSRAAREYPIAGTRPHVVGAGETPWRLAETHRIPFWLLEQANPDRDLSSVKAGDTLRIPILRPPTP